jgi:hypothetical protein
MNNDGGAVALLIDEICDGAAMPVIRLMFRRLRKRSFYKEAMRRGY